MHFLFVYSRQSGRFDTMPWELGHTSGWLCFLRRRSINPVQRPHVNDLCGRQVEHTHTHMHCYLQEVQYTLSKNGEFADAVLGLQDDAYVC